MKVGRIILMTAIMLALSTLAVAGPVDPCFPSTDLDLDGICDNVDNCPPGVNHPTGVANPTQVDGDLDGRGNSCDNCLTVPNGPALFASGTGSFATGDSQCDTNTDGFGNGCDGDMNNNGTVTPTDNPLYLMAPFATPGRADMNCDGFKSALDNVRYLVSLMNFTRFTSGWACAAAPLMASVPGTCPPLP